jgi:hypothetical protein
MPIAACTAQIKQKTRDPMKTGSDVGTAHFVGYAEEVLLLRKELKAKPSTAIEVIDHYLTHYYTQEMKDRLQAEADESGDDYEEDN